MANWWFGIDPLLKIAPLKSLSSINLGQCVHCARSDRLGIHILIICQPQHGSCFCGCLFKYCFRLGCLLQLRLHVLELVKARRRKASWDWMSASFTTQSVSQASSNRLNINHWQEQALSWIDLGKCVCIYACVSCFWLVSYPIHMEHAYKQIHVQLSKEV